MGKFNFKLFGFILLWVGVTLGAQTNFISRYSNLSGIKAKFIVKKWTTKDGLPQNSIQDIEQTNDGFLWLATLNGLVRFDGSDFFTFNAGNTNLPFPKRISSLALDNRGGLWIGGLNGKLFYLFNNKFTDFSNVIKAKGSNINDLEVDRYNKLWIACDNGIFVLTKGKVKKYSIKNLPVRYLTINAYNPMSVLIGTTDGLYVLKQKKFVAVSQFIGKIITSIISDKMGAYWIGCSTGLYLYKNKQVSYQPVSTYRSNEITYIFSDSHKRLWVGSAFNGLFINLEYSNCLFNRFELKSPILKIFEDKGGNIWVGTFNKGLFRFTERMIFPIQIIKEKFNNEFFSVFQRKNGEVWAGTISQGVFQFINGKINNFTVKDGLTNNFIFSIYEDKTNEFWCGSYYNGLSKWTGYGFVPFDYNNNFTNKSILAIFQDNNLGYWIGTKWGLYYLKKNKIKVFTTKDGLCNNHIKAITQTPDGVIWITTNNGISYYRNNKFYNLKLPHNFKIYNCGSILVDKTNRLWIGTYGEGLLTYYKGKVDLITEQDGLADNVILSLLEDDSGNFWFSSNKGLSRVSKKELLDFISGKIPMVNTTVFTREDGLITEEFNGNSNSSSVKLHDGTLLFPSMNGLVAVNPQINKLGFEYRKVFIDRIVVNNKYYYGDSLIQVPNDRNNITLHFSTIKFYKPYSKKIKFRIQGYIDDWVILNKERNYNLVNVPAGNYEIEAALLGDENSTGIVKVKLKVMPRFNQTLFFKIFIVVLIIALFLFLLRFRDYQLNKKEKKLQRLIQERTDEIQKAKENLEKINNEKSELIRIVTHNLKNPLSVIQNSGQLILEELKDSEYVKELAKLIIGSSNHMLKAVEELLECELIESPEFTITKEKVNIVDIIKESIIKNKINAIRKKQKITFKSENEEIIVNCDPGKIIEVIDNYLSNAIKYSPFNSEIKIEVEETPETVKVTVIDEGPGLNSEDLKKVFGKFTKLSAKPTNKESSTGLGLSIAKRLVELHGGKVGVKSEPKKGSAFYFEIPK